MTQESDSIYKSKAHVSPPPLPPVHPVSKETSRSTWQVRDVDEETKRIARVYAADNNVTLAEALARLVSAGKAALQK